MNGSDSNIGEYAAPVLAVCGYSGSGKTTLLETAIRELVQRGLAVAVVKHDAHRFEVDRPGKDSDRLFRAGATVSLRGPKEQFERRSETLSLEATLERLACDNDLLLVEGHKSTALPKFWLASDREASPPPEVAGIVGALPWSPQPSGDRLAAFLHYVENWLPKAWQTRPVYGGLLLGGKSSRMGQPKHSLPFGGSTLGEIALRALGAAAPNEQARVVLLGSGEPLERAERLPRLPDAPEFAGPGAGIIAAHRWAPRAAWLISACDHPWLSREHIAWLAAQRKPGRWAIVPRQPDGHPCPMLALYEPQALQAMLRLAAADDKHNAHPSALLEHARTAVLQPPKELSDGWININTPEELRREEARTAVEGAARNLANRVQD